MRIVMKKGTLVWLNDNEGRKVNTNEVWTITSVIPMKDAGDWCDHVKVTDGKVEKEVREYMCIICPVPSTPFNLRYQNYLEDNGLVGFDLCLYNDGESASIDIFWGDWKHDHGYADYLMSVIGYTVSNEVVTEEDGSDCYSSIHYYEKCIQ